MRELLRYDRARAVDYARKWVNARNPEYMNFDGMGGDCANFASQCLYAGLPMMNYTRDTGWYYISPKKRAPAWSGARFLLRFLTQNEGAGPFGEEAALNALERGDLIFLGANRPYHTLVVIEPDGEDTLIAAHTYDAWLRPLSAYRYDSFRAVHVRGGRRRA